MTVCAACGLPMPEDYPGGRHYNPLDCMAAWRAVAEHGRQALETIADYGLDNINCAQIRAFHHELIDIAERALEGSH